MDRVFVGFGMFELMKLKKKNNTAEMAIFFRTVMPPSFRQAFVPLFISAYMVASVTMVQQGLRLTQKNSFHLLFMSCSCIEESLRRNSKKLMMLERVMELATQNTLVGNEARGSPARSREQATLKPAGRHSQQHVALNCGC